LRVFGTAQGKEPMGYRAALVLIVVATLAPLAHGNAQNQSQSFTAANEAFAAGDYLRALEHFEDALNAGVVGPAIEYNIAVCHYRLAHYGQAERAFRSIANRYPDLRALAEYNLGLVLLQQDRDSEAQALFEQVRTRSSDANLASLAAAALGLFDESNASETSRQWVSLVDVTVGHDDNVALIDDASVPAGQSVASGFTETFAVLSGPLSPRGFRFDGSAYVVHYYDAEAFDQTVLRVAGAYRWSASDWTIEPESHLAQSTLDGSGFEERFGLGLSLRRRLDSDSVVGIQVVHDEVDGADAELNYLEGSRDVLGTTWDRYGTGRRLTIGYQLESNDRVSPGVSAMRNRFWTRFRYTLKSVWTVDLGLSLRTSAYDDLAVPRTEDLKELSFGLTRTFARGLRLNGTYRWSDNDSTDALYSYTRGRAGLGVTKSF
jgi:tetratricopeptide (TPR) repeat protein